MLNYKKAQIGTTISWTVATIAIVIILTLFVYSTILISGGKKLSSVQQNVEVVGTHDFDLFMTETALGFLKDPPNVDFVNVEIESDAYKQSYDDCLDRDLIENYNFNEQQKQDVCKLIIYLIKFGGEK